MVNTYQKRKGTCKGPQCTRTIWAKGMCGSHYTQKKRGAKRLSPLRDHDSRTDASGDLKQCTFDGCKFKVKAVGLCTGHYKQRYDGRLLKPLQRNSRTAGK